MLWHYSHQLGRCVQFVFSGCGGNRNRFMTRQDCELACSNLASPDSYIHTRILIQQPWSHNLIENNVREQFGYRDLDLGSQTPLRYQYQVGKLLYRLLVAYNHWHTTNVCSNFAFSLFTLLLRSRVESSRSAAWVFALKSSAQAWLRVQIVIRRPWFRPESGLLSAHFARNALHVCPLATITGSLL